MNNSYLGKCQKVMTKSKYHSYLSSNSASSRSFHASRSSGRGTETLPGICGRALPNYTCAGRARRENTNNWRPWKTEFFSPPSFITNLSVFYQLLAATNINEENGAVTFERILQLLNQSTSDQFSLSIVYLMFLIEVPQIWWLWTRQSTMAWMRLRLRWVSQASEATL